MIRINLLGESKDNTALYILQMLIFGVCVGATVIACVFVQAHYSGNLSAASNEKSLLDSQLAKLKEKTKKVEELEKNKKFLGEKLTTIAGLKAKRQGPVQMMANLTASVPERAWITDLTQKGEELEIQGVSVDPQTVSLFMRDLQNSIFFKSVDLSYSRLFSKDGVKLQKFAVVGKLQDPIELQRKILAAEKGEVLPEVEAEKPERTLRPEPEAKKPEKPKKPKKPANSEE
jgi:type IV pilus assembly protein PilN